MPQELRHSKERCVHTHTPPLAIKLFEQLNKEFDFSQKFYVGGMESLVPARGPLASQKEIAQNAENLSDALRDRPEQRQLPSSNRQDHTNWALSCLYFLLSIKPKSTRHGLGGHWTLCSSPQCHRP